MLIESPLERPGRVASLRLTIPSGEAGTDATVDAMRAVAVSASELPRVRRWAARLKTAGALHEFLYERVTFRPDPVHEKIRHPNRMLQEVEDHGRTQGDCDDLATLAASIMLVMGLRPVIIVMAREEHGPFVHTYPGVLEGARYVPMDPQERYPFGSEAASPRRKVYLV